MAPDDFTVLDTKRGRRCISCNTLIKVGQDCGKFPAWRHPESDIEERIHGDEVPMATKYMCEECTGLFFSITELGYCLSLDGTPMREEVKMIREEYE